MSAALPPARDFAQPVPCWRCGYVMDAFTHAGPDDVTPDDGSVSVCLECGTLSLFVSTPFGMTLRQPSADELDGLLRDPAVVRVLLARQQSFDQDEPQ